MRFSLAFAIFTVSLCQPNVLGADEGLFSEVAMESVFAKTAPASHDVAKADTAEPPDRSTLEASTNVDRITGTSLLVEVLKAADLEPRVEDGRARIRLQHAGWKFPVSLEVQVDQERILCQMSLIAVEEEEITPRTLLELLSLGDTIGGAFFAYDRDSKMLQVRRSLANRVVTPRQLKADLTQMANLAVTNADVWSKLPSTKNPKPATFSPIGRWTASMPGGESLAIALTADSKFQLVHLNAGKSTVSAGNVTRSGDRLTLVGDDSVTLHCHLTQNSADRFQLTILDAKGKASVRIDFKKAR